jgi:hypothetical protein
LKAEASSKAADAWTKSQASSPDKKSAPMPIDAPATFLQRVDVAKWEKEVISELADNSYEHQFGADGYGAKANAKLITTQGKSFRHEKTKKKRGSYRGGPIDMGSNSFKYDSD